MTGTSDPSPVSPSRAVDLLARATDTSHHQFWPCDLSLLDEKAVDRTRVHGPRQVTDAYLLALAVRHDGRLVTFDSSLARSAVPEAPADALVVL